MSTLKTNNVQVGQSVTATNNFTWYQPSSPDGTVRLGVGNTGATTADVAIASNTGVVNFPSGVQSGGTVLLKDPGANGIAARTASGTTTARTLTAGTGISITNGDGVSGNPTISSTVTGGVTSITAGNGLTGGTITTTGTIALDYYTGSSSTNTSFPIGSYLFTDQDSGPTTRNASVTLYYSGSVSYRYQNQGSNALAGTWRARGVMVWASGCNNFYNGLYQRTA
jgi:hypothetical protein